MRPYIPIKDSDGTVFQATHLTAEPEVEVNGDVFYCVVAYDANHGLKKNIYGDRIMEKAISELAILTEQLVPVMTQAAIADWKRENEIEE